MPLKSGHLVESDEGYQGTAETEVAKLGGTARKATLILEEDISTVYSTMSA